MHDNFWNLFSLTGNISAYMAYKWLLYSPNARDEEARKDAT